MYGIWIQYDGFRVKAFPDNDGGLWFYHPETRMTVRITED